MAAARMREPLARRPAGNKADGAGERGERLRRWQLLMESVNQEDVVWWRQRFLDVLLDATGGN